MILRYAYLFFILLILLSCDPPIDDCKKSYDFVIPVTLEPALDTMTLDDTLTISFEFPKKIINQEDSNLVFLDDQFPWNFAFNCAWIDVSPSESAEHEFTFEAISGELRFIQSSLDILLVSLLPEERDGNFVMKFNISPKDVGTLAIGLSNKEPLTGFPAILENDCKASEISFRMPINNQVDNNYFLNQFSPDPRIQGISKEFFDKWGGYVVVVGN